jgi:ribokinase
VKKICVLGSINIDLVTKTQAFPKAGQTVTGYEFCTFPGGKGANQAVAAGRLGADVTFLGKVGSDTFGEMALASLSEANVDVSYIKKEQTSTGTASITVNAQGENTIIVVPGANGLVDVDYVRSHIKAIDDADILMLQLEIPMETVEWAADYAAKAGKLVILDPAPAVTLPEKLLECSSIVTPNETELAIISQMDVKDDISAIEAARALMGQGVGTVVHKSGGKGAYLITNKDAELVPGFKVSVVDTTAAGDSFNAGLAVSLAKGNDLKESIRYANAVGAMSVTKMGAQSAMPTEAELKAFIESNLN